MATEKGMTEENVVQVTGEADELMEEGLDAETAKEAMEKYKMKGRQLPKEIVEGGLVKDLLRGKLEDDGRERVEEESTGDSKVRKLSVQYIWFHLDRSYSYTSSSMQKVDLNFRWTVLTYNSI